MSMYLELFGIIFQLFIGGLAVNVDARIYFAITIGWKHRYLYGVKWYKTGMAIIGNQSSSIEWLWHTKTRVRGEWI